MGSNPGPTGLRLAGNGFLVIVCTPGGTDGPLEILAPPGDYAAWPMLDRRRHIVELLLDGPSIPGPLAERDAVLPIEKGDYVCFVDNAQKWPGDAFPAVREYLHTGTAEGRPPVIALPIAGTDSAVLVAGPMDKGNWDLWHIFWQRGNQRPARVRLVPND